MSQRRFGITDSPTMLPGSCFFCPGSVREWYIDTYDHVEFHGRMYICNHCLAEMARTAGYLTPDQADLLKGKLRKLAEEKHDLMVEVARLERNVDALLERRSPRLSESLSQSYVNGRPVEDLELPSAGEENMGVGEGAPTESSDDEAVGELRSDESTSEPAIAELRLF